MLWHRLLLHSQLDKIYKLAIITNKGITHTYKNIIISCIWSLMFILTALVCTNI